MTAQKCQYSGCNGSIEQGFCNHCGLEPAGAAASISLPISRRTSAATSSARTGVLSSITGSLSGRTGSLGTTHRTTGTSRSSTRRHLGLGLVNVPGLPELDPEQIVMADPKVPDHKRFCGNADCVDAAGQPTALNRRLTGHCPNCGKFYNFVPSLKPGEVVGEQYEVKGCLAFGGLGWIYLAKDISLSRWVVLKGLLNSADESAAAAAVAERQFLASVKHANIVGVYNFVKRGQEGFIVMEYVGGSTVKEVRKTRGPLPPAEAISYIHRILGAFAYLHDRGLVFCDFKPDNFMLEGDPPDVKLIDMGGVRMISDAGGDIYGTKGYSAPEAGEGPTVVTDLYTIGRTLAVLLMDFRFQSACEFTLPTPAEQPVLQTHESLYRFLLKSTAREPLRRFQSADEMAEQLGGVLREVVVIETGETPSRAAESSLFACEHMASDDRGDISQPSAALLPEFRIDADDPAAGDVMSAAIIADPAKRVAALTLAGERHVRSIELELRLAHALIQSGDYTKAEFCLADCGELIRQGILLEAGQRLGDEESRKPGDWRIAWYRGLSLLYQKRADEAYALFDSVYADLPGEPAAKLALALAAEIAGNGQAAVVMYDLVSKVDPSFATAAFGLARCLSRSGWRAEAAEAYRRVPQNSSLYERAQMGLARVLCGMQPSPPAADDLCQASTVIEALALDGPDQTQLRAEILENALTLLKTKAVAPDGSRLIFGQPLVEKPLRFALEKSLRQLARMQADRGRQIHLVDRANAARPWTWV